MAAAFFVLIALLAGIGAGAAAMETLEPGNGQMWVAASVLLAISALFLFLAVKSDEQKTLPRRGRRWQR
jgi:hypothetical protein